MPVQKGVILSLVIIAGSAGIFGLFMASLHYSFFFLLLSIPNFVIASFFGYKYYSLNKASAYKSTHARK
jgi:hypothetical protein